MKKSFVTFLLAALAGCASNPNPPVLQSLDGKPRVQINKQVPPSTATVKQPEGR
jgi:hypothetical protein